MNRQAERQPAARVLAALVRGYQLGIRPVMAPHCRYWPSCSDYAVEALHEHGAWRGGWLAARRLCRCHPWAAGGVDPVPSASVVDIPPSSSRATRALRARNR